MKSNRNALLPIEKYSRSFRNCQNSITNALIPTSRRPQSVFFFTFHKCASTLFDSLVLKQVIGLRNKNIAQDIYNQKIDSSKSLTFKGKGFIYGPIRVTHKFEGNPLEDLLLEQVTDPEFMRSKRAVFLVRDPRAILTSAYYAFGFSQLVMSKNPTVRQRQERERQEIQEITVDEYAIAKSGKLLEAFERLDVARRHCQKGIVLKYEDLVEDFDAFTESLCRFLPLRERTIELMYRESRPKQSEDVHSHKRSGLPSGFRSKLLPETIEVLNQRFAMILERYQYEY